MPPALKTGKMPALIVIWLLALFTWVLVYPMVKDNSKPSDVILQTLLMLVVSGISFYIGTTQKSGEKDVTIANALPQAGGTIAIDTSKGPVPVQEVKTSGNPVS